MTKAIDIKRNDDGTWTVYYFDKEAGYISTIKCGQSDKRYADLGLRYRAVSVHGPLMHTKSLTAAKQFVIENYG